MALASHSPDPIHWNPSEYSPNLRPSQHLHSSKPGPRVSWMCNRLFFLPSSHCGHSSKKGPGGTAIRPVADFSVLSRPVGPIYSSVTAETITTPYQGGAAPPPHTHTYPSPAPHSSHTGLLAPGRNRLTPSPCRRLLPGPARSLPLVGAVSLLHTISFKVL